MELLESQEPKNPLGYNLCMLKIWTDFIKIKFGDSMNKEALYYLDQIERSTHEINDALLGLMDAQEGLQN